MDDHSRLGGSREVLNYFEMGLKTCSTVKLVCTQKKGVVTAIRLYRVFESESEIFMCAACVAHIVHIVSFLSVNQDFAIGSLI